MQKHPRDYGYYHITLTHEDGGTLMCSNGERAFAIAQLHYFLSPRLVLGDIPAYKQLASCIDLLAFSIKTDAVHLVLFSINPGIGRYFVECFVTQLSQYLHYQHTYSKSTPEKINIRTSIVKLRGPHHALEQSTLLHLLHEDWEYDRYSSIGFYLHDRRGDWMRTWRLARLYDNNSGYYMKLLQDRMYAHV